MELKITLDSDSQETLLRLCEQYRQNPSEVFKILLYRTVLRQERPKTWDVDSHRELWFSLSQRHVKGLTSMCNSLKIDDLEKAIDVAVREYLDNR